MARARVIKPEFWEDPKVGRLSREARLLYIGLWNLADDVGNVQVEPAFLRARLFAYDDDVTVAHVDRWVAELVEEGRLRPYRARGERYAAIPTFVKHQRIARMSQWRNPTPDEDRCALPGVDGEPSQHLDEPSHHLHGCSLSAHDLRSEHSVPKPKPETKTTTPPVVPPTGRSPSVDGGSGGGDATSPHDRSREKAAPRRRGSSCSSPLARETPASEPFSVERARTALLEELTPEGVDEACVAEALRQVEGRLAAGGEAITSPLRLAEELARSVHREHLERQRDEETRGRWERVRRATAAAEAGAPGQPCHHGAPPGDRCDACREEGAALRAGGWREILAGGGHAARNGEASDVTKTEEVVL
jgi:hypothetical protein